MTYQDKNVHARRENATHRARLEAARAAFREVCERLGVPHWLVAPPPSEIDDGGQR